MAKLANEPKSLSSKCTLRSFQIKTNVIKSLFNYLLVFTNVFTRHPLNRILRNLEKNTN